MEDKCSNNSAALKTQHERTRFGSIAGSRHWENEKAGPNTAGRRMRGWDCRSLLLWLAVGILSADRPQPKCFSLKTNKEAPAAEPAGVKSNTCAAENQSCQEWWGPKVHVSCLHPSVRSRYYVKRNSLLHKMCLPCFLGGFRRSE